MKKIVTASSVLVGIILVGLFLSFVLFPASRLGYIDSAIGSLRILNNSARTYATAHPQRGFPNTLEDIHTDRLIDEILASGVKNHHRYTYLPRISVEAGSVSGYQIHADPMDCIKCWHFYTDETGVIRAREGTPANETSPSL